MTSYKVDLISKICLSSYDSCRAGTLIKTFNLSLRFHVEGVEVDWYENMLLQAFFKLI